MKVSLEQCQWCNGTGNGAVNVMDTPYPCTDCEGTGFKYGKQAEKEWERQIEEEWKKADKLLDEQEKAEGDTP